MQELLTLRARRSPLRAAHRPFLSPRVLRWLAFSCALVALGALGWLLYSSLRAVGNNAAGAPTDPMLVVILAAAVTGAGVIALIWILVTASNHARRLAWSADEVQADLRQTWRSADSASDTAHTVSAKILNSNAAIAQSGPSTGAAGEVARAFEDRLRTLRDLSCIGYWQNDSRGCWTRVECAHDESQLRLAELNGKSRPALAADDAARAALAIMQRRVDARQAFRQIVWRCRLPSGPVLTIRESGLPRFDRAGSFIGYQGTIEEVSTAALDPVKNHRVTQALGALPTPLMLLHRQHRDNDATHWKLVWANAALSNLSERSEVELGELDPQRWLLCAPKPADGTSHVDRDASTGGTGTNTGSGSVLSRMLQAGITHRGAGIVIDRYGRRRPVQLTLERIDDDADGQLSLIAVDPVAAEFASLREEAATVRQAQRDENKRALEMEVTKRELESFSHAVSHDLRHPVRVVDGFARMLQDDYAHVLDRNGNEHLNRILAASHRMNTMIDALIDLHRISAQPIVSDPVDLTALAASIIDELRSNEPQRNVTVEIENHLACRGDRVLLRMALFNLLENAWKYTARTPDSHISFSAVTLYDTLVYRVSDNGVGFDMRYVDRLFDLFHRLHGQTEFKGSGVGLATVQRAVRRHGGRIWAESTPGEGSRFLFTLWDENARAAEAGKVVGGHSTSTSAALRDSART